VFSGEVFESPHIQRAIGGSGLPQWPAFTNTSAHVMNLDDPSKPIDVHAWPKGKLSVGQPSLALVKYLGKIPSELHTQVPGDVH
jgi:hypothetical protein